MPVPVLSLAQAFNTTAGVGSSYTAASLAATGASAGAATGILGAASAAMPYVAVAGAVIGGILGGIQANETNDAIRKNLINTYEAVDKATEENRLAFYDVTMRASAQAADEISQARIAFSGYGSGISNNETLAQIQNDKTYDQTVRRTNLNTQEENYQIQKQNAYEQAKSQVVNPFMGILQGALQGFGAGASVGGAVESGAKGMLDNQALTTFAEDWDTNGASDVNLARAQALRSGVPARFLVNGNTSNAYLAPFLYQLESDKVARNMLERNLTTSNANFDIFRQMNSNSLNNINSYENNRFLNPNGYRRQQSVDSLLQRIRGY